MNTHDIYQWLIDHQDEKIKKIYQANNPYEVIGVKMTDLRAFAKTMGVDHSLALACYQIDIFEMKMLATMMIDVNLMSYELIEAWAKDAKKTIIVDQGLSHIMITQPQNYENYLSWCDHQDESLRYAGYVFLSGYFRHVELDGIDIEKSKNLLSKIGDTIAKEHLTIQNAMNNAVVMAGLHVPLLVDTSYEMANKIGYILPLKAKNQCNIQSATDYLNRYLKEPKYSRVARLNIKRKEQD